MKLLFIRALAAITISVFHVQVILAAEPLPQPTEPVILTVNGAVGVTNAGDAAAFDRTMLEALPPVTIRTSTIWTEGVREFTGVSLRILLNRLGVLDGTLTATALNDYSVEIPITDAAEGGPIVAYAIDGKPMSVRNKGPLWIVYPYDSDPAYQTEVVYSRSIWQLDRMTISR
jgi:hypothetical protein